MTIKNTSDTPDYMNPNHPKFAIELAATVKVWQAMDDENLLRLKPTIQESMENWLFYRYKELGLERDGKVDYDAIKRCAGIANWEE